MKGCDHIISYKPLWETMKDRGISQYQMIGQYDFSSGTMDSLGKNRGVNINILYRLCKILNCGINDVVEFTMDD